MKKLKQFLTELAESNITLKVGDRIRTKMGGQIPGIVTKIEGNKVYFDHATAKYDTVWSGAKGKPKQYFTHISNVVKDELNEVFSQQQLNKLKQEYETLNKIDPTSKSYKQLIDLLNNLPQDHLKQLAAHNIKFVSALAKNRIKKNLGERCWDGYKPTPGKKPYEKGSCMKEEDDEDLHEDAEYDGRKVTLNKPFRTPDGPKKFAVYVKNDKGNVVKVAFGDPNMEIKRDDPERRANYRARHNCSDPGPKWKANYWSCKMWSDKPVSKITEAAPPDAEIEKWIKANKERFKKEYGEEKGLSVLYAKAWDMYNNK